MTDASILEHNAEHVLASRQVGAAHVVVLLDRRASPSATERNALDAVLDCIDAREACSRDLASEGGDGGEGDDSGTKYGDQIGDAPWREDDQPVRADGGTDMSGIERFHAEGASNVYHHYCEEIGVETMAMPDTSGRLRCCRCGSFCETSTGDTHVRPFPIGYSYRSVDTDSDRTDTDVRTDGGVVEGDPDGMLVRDALDELAKGQRVRLHYEDGDFDQRTITGDIVDVLAYGQTPWALAIETADRRYRVGRGGAVAVDRGDRWGSAGTHARLEVLD